MEVGSPHQKRLMLSQDHSGTVVSASLVWGRHSRHLALNLGILVWSTIPLDTDLGKIGNPKEVPP
jgi:hypothetical protein